MLSLVRTSPLLLLALAVPARANTIATESTFSKDAVTQTFSYEGHQSLQTHDIRNGLMTWNLSASLAKSGSGDSSSNTIGAGAGLGWRNWNWDLTAGFAYSNNSTTQTTTLGPSATIAYRLEFQPPLRRRKKPKLRPGVPASAQPKPIPAEAELGDLAASEEPSFKPSLTVRGGLRYQKISQSSTTPAGSGAIALPVATESSNDLSQLSATAIAVLSPAPSFALGGGITHFSYTQSSSSTTGNSILDAHLDQLNQAEQNLARAASELASLSSLSSLGSQDSIGSLGSRVPQLGGTGVQASDLPVFGSAFTFGALPRDSLDVILMIFPASWLDFEARATLTLLNGSDDSSKDVKGTFYFHLSDAWTLGAGGEYAFTSASKETFVSAALSYVFF